MIYLVCGSRAFDDPLSANNRIINRIEQLPLDAFVIHGDAQGADREAGRVALRRGLATRPYPADWETHSDCTCKDRGPGTTCWYAGYRRNLEMLDVEPDLVIAFWNGSSRGTEHTITEAKRRGIPVEVIRC